MLGLVSTLLLTAGFARAAEQFDPISDNPAIIAKASLLDGTPQPAPPCTPPEGHQPL